MISLPLKSDHYQRISDMLYIHAHDVISLIQRYSGDNGSYSEIHTAGGEIFLVDTDADIIRDLIISELRKELDEN